MARILNHKREGLHACKLIYSCDNNIHACKPSRLWLEIRATELHWLPVSARVDYTILVLTYKSPARPRSSGSPYVVPAWPRSPLWAQQSAVCAQDKTQDVPRQGLSPRSIHSVELDAPSCSLGTIPGFVTFEIRIQTFLFDKSYT